jgi:hypothetical protein
MVGRLFGCSFVRLVVWLLGWLVVGSVGRLNGWFVEWLFGYFAGRLAGLSDCLLG